MPAPKGNKNAVGNKGGRPTKFKEEFIELAFKFCLLGATNEDLARNFEVDVSTIEVWIRDKVEFQGSIKRGREEADANVANRLYSRAMGYEHDEEKIFQFQGVPIRVETRAYYPPDTAAAIFWLKNRQKDKWRDKSDLDVTSKGERIGDVKDLSDEELLRLINQRNTEGKGD